MIDPVLSASVTAFVGDPGHLDPRSAEERVVASVGDRGLGLIRAVTQIVDSVYEADPPLYNRPSISEVGEAAQDFLRGRYPELSDEAVRAVANRFSFDWK